MLLTGSILCGFALDLLLADPAWMPHPVVYMGTAKGEHLGSFSRSSRVISSAAIPT